MTVDALPSRTLQYEGNEYLFFSGTSYLGMGHQAAFKKALIASMVQYGSIFSASRNNNLQLDIYEKAEKHLAHWVGAEAALTVTSGLLAGQLVVQSLENQQFIYAPATHPALWYSGMSAFHNQDLVFENYADFSNKIVKYANEINTPTTICSNSIDPLRCEPYNFDWVKHLPNKSNLTLIFDDSHGIGVTYTGGTSRENREGGGIMQFLKESGIIERLSNVKIIVIASMAKALGIPGGVIFSDIETISKIRKNPLFVGASPIVPAYLSAFLKSPVVYKKAQNRLLHNINYFKTELKKQNIPNDLFKNLPNYPVFYTLENELAVFLMGHKIMISSFAYPNPDSPPITRIIISALHTEGDIRTLVSAIAMYKTK